MYFPRHQRLYILSANLFLSGGLLRKSSLHMGQTSSCGLQFPQTALSHSWNKLRPCSLPYLIWMLFMNEHQPGSRISSAVSADRRDTRLRALGVERPVVARRGALPQRFSDALSRPIGLFSRPVKNVWRLNLQQVATSWQGKCILHVDRLQDEDNIFWLVTSF